MLYPQNNKSRITIDMSGIWDFRLGEGPWQRIAVPASYNDQSPDPLFRSHAGTVCYRTQLNIPALFHGMRYVLRFDAVAHDATVLLDGEEIGRHRGGFLPFEIDLTDRAEPGSVFDHCLGSSCRICDCSQ